MKLVCDTGRVVSYVAKCEQTLLLLLLLLLALLPALLLQTDFKAPSHSHCCRFKQRQQQR
jgi:hypothetical protein